MTSTRLYSVDSPDLTPAFEGELRAFLDAAFDGDFSDDDWSHALGGLHVWVADASGIVSHGSVIDRTLACSGQTMSVGFVEAVATAASHRGRGYGSTVMRHLGEVIRARQPLGALSTGAHAFYEALGWERWRGPTFVDGPRGHERTPNDDGDVMVLRTPRTPSLDLGAPIVCDWRAGDVW